jgi:hypothetical protein
MHRLLLKIFPHLRRLRDLEEGKKNYEKAYMEVLNERDKLKDELALANVRMTQLEDHDQEAFQVPMRHVQTLVQSDFNKFELVLMQSGVIRLAKDAKTLDDMEILMKLARKIMVLLDQMPDEQEFKANPKKG